RSPRCGSAERFTNATRTVAHACARPCYPAPRGWVMESNLHRARLRLFDLLVPERCASCGAGERIVCASCLATLQLLREPLCARCGATTACPVARCAAAAARRLPCG